MDQGAPGIDWTRIDEGIRGYWQLVDELHRVEPSESDIQHVRHILQTQPMPEAVRRCLKDALPKKEPTQRFAAERFQPQNHGAITKPNTLCVLPPEELDTIEEVSLPTQDIPKIRVKEYGPDVSGLIAQPEDAVLHLVPPGPHDLRIGTSTYREVDDSTTVELLRRGILLGMEVRSGGQWIPVTAHPAFARLVESAHGETERVLKRLLPESIPELSSTEEITVPATPWDIDVDTLKSVDSLEMEDALTQEFVEALETTEDQEVTAELVGKVEERVDFNDLDEDEDIDLPTSVMPARKRPPDKEPHRPVEVIKEVTGEKRIPSPSETAELSRAMIRTTEPNLVIPVPRRVGPKRKNRQLVLQALIPILIGLVAVLVWNHLKSGQVEAEPLATSTNPFVVHLAKKTLSESIPDTNSGWWREQALALIEESPQGALKIYAHLLETSSEPALLFDYSRAQLAVGDLKSARASALRALGSGVEREIVLELLRETFVAESPPEFQDVDLASLGRARTLKDSIVFESENTRTYIVLPDRNQTWLSHVAASRYLEMLGISTGIVATPVRVDVADLDRALPRSDRGKLGGTGTIQTAMYTVNELNRVPVPLELKEIWLPWARGERLDDSLGAQLLAWDRVNPKSRPDLIESVGPDFGVRDLFAQIQSLFLADFLVSHPSRLESNARNFGRNTALQNGRLVSAQPLALNRRSSRRALWLSNYIGDLTPETQLLLEALEPEVAEARIVPDGLESRGDIDRRLELLWERRSELLK